MAVFASNGVLGVTTPVNDINDTYDLELLGVVFSGSNAPVFTPDNNNETNFYLDEITNDIWYWDIGNQIWVTSEEGLHAGIEHYASETITGNDDWVNITFEVNHPSEPIPTQWGDVQSFYSGPWYSTFDKLVIPETGMYLCSSYLSVYIPEPPDPVSIAEDTLIKFRLVNYPSQSTIAQHTLLWGTLGGFGAKRFINLSGHTRFTANDEVYLQVKFDNMNFQIYTEHPVTGLGFGITPYITISKLV